MESRLRCMQTLLLFCELMALQITENHMKLSNQINAFQPTCESYMQTVLEFFFPLSIFPCHVSVFSQKKVRGDPQRFLSDTPEMLVE
jgi:hypothetical protein